MSDFEWAIPTPSGAVPTKQNGVFTLGTSFQFVNANQSRYGPVEGYLAALDLDGTTVLSVMPVPMTIIGIFMYIRTADANAQIMEVMLLKNENITALTFNLPGGSPAGMYSDVNPAHAVAVAAGDTLCYRVTTGPSAGPWPNIRSLALSYTRPLP